jgi:hypothetical protein
MSLKFDHSWAYIPGEFTFVFLRKIKMPPDGKYLRCNAAFHLFDVGHLCSAHSEIWCQIQSFYFCWMFRLYVITLVNEIITNHNHDFI